MDEKRWLTEPRNAQYMVFTLSQLHFPRTKSGRRKLRLFACGVCRMVSHLLPEPAHRSALEVAERFADGTADRKALADAERELGGWFAKAQPGRDNLNEWSAVGFVYATCTAAAYDAAFSMTALNPSPLPLATGDSPLCDLLRCVFGNPFRRPAFSKTWRTEAVTALATGIDEGRAFDRLPILADALEEAGCDDPAILAHLRGPGPHCRGCWVLDLALGKG